MTSSSSSSAVCHYELGFGLPIGDERGESLNRFRLILAGAEQASTSKIIIKLSSDASPGVFGILNRTSSVVPDL